MCIGFKVWYSILLPRRWNFLTLVALSLALAGGARGQTAPSGAVLPGVMLHLKNQDGSEAKSATSDNNGRFAFFLLPPATYEAQATKVDFRPVSQRDIHVHVTETLRLELHLEIATPLEH